MVGTSVSVTTTSKLHDAVLFDASVTTNVLVVVPLGKKEPLVNPDSRPVTAPLQLSPKKTLYVTYAPHNPAAVLTGIFPGQLMVGSCVSETITSKLQTAEFPEASVTVSVTELPDPPYALPLEIL